MLPTVPLRKTAAALLAGLALTVGTVTIATLPASPALAQTPDDFRIALESYGFWQPHPRWGEVWVPFGKPASWRPYTIGRWVYTDEWGWYWASGQDEEAWGWITFHYGRWVHDRRLGWAWVPGDEWAPAWVNWRRSNSIVGWAPAPPEDVIYDYDDDPAYWSFVEPRYLVAPRVYSHFVPSPRVVTFISQTVVVNRAFVSGRGARFAVNPGISPAFVAARVGRPLDTYRVRPRVLAGTQGVAGAVSIQAAQNRVPGGARPDGGRRGPSGTNRPAAALPPVSIQRAATVAPAQSMQAPQALGRERGRLGSMPPRAAGGPVRPGAPSAAGSQAAPPVGAPPATMPPASVVAPSQRGVRNPSGPAADPPSGPAADPMSRSVSRPPNEPVGAPPPASQTRPQPSAAPVRPPAGALRPGNIGSPNAGSPNAGLPPGVRPAMRPSPAVPPVARPQTMSPRPAPPSAATQRPVPPPAMGPRPMPQRAQPVPPRPQASPQPPMRPQAPPPQIQRPAPPSVARPAPPAARPAPPAAMRPPSQQPARPPAPP
jgi:hypothetical protein